MRKIVTVQLNTYFNSAKDEIVDLDHAIRQQMKEYVRQHGLPVVINNIKPVEYNGGGQLSYKVAYYDQFELVKSMLADHPLVNSVRLV